MRKMWTIKNDVIEKDLSYKLVGIFFKIHRELGRFCRERQYCDALELELKLHQIRFHREYPYTVAGRLSNRVDFVIEDRVIVDVKAKPIVQPEDYHQMRRYLDSANIKLGIIVNFRSKYLYPKRVLGAR